MKNIPCTGKVQFASLKIANEVANRKNRSDSKRRAKPYKCKYCDTYHLGTSIIPKHSRNWFDNYQQVLNC